MVLSIWLDGRTEEDQIQLSYFFVVVLKFLLLVVVF